MAKKFTFYESFLEAAEMLELKFPDKPEICRDFLMGIALYGIRGIKPESDISTPEGAMLDMAFLLALPNVKASADRADILERARKAKEAK